MFTIIFVNKKENVFFANKIWSLVVISQKCSLSSENQGLNSCKLASDHVANRFPYENAEYDIGGYILVFRIVVLGPLALLVPK